MRCYKEMGRNALDVNSLIEGALEKKGKASKVSLRLPKPSPHTWEMQLTYELKGYAVCVYVCVCRKNQNFNCNPSKKKRVGAFPSLSPFSLFFPLSPFTKNKCLISLRLPFICTPVNTWPRVVPLKTYIRRGQKGDGHPSSPPDRFNVCVCVRLL